MLLRQDNKLRLGAHLFIKKILFEKRREKICVYLGRFVEMENNKALCKRKECFGIEMVFRQWEESGNAEQNIEVKC